MKKHLGHLLLAGLLPGHPPKGKHFWTRCGVDTPSSHLSAVKICQVLPGASTNTTTRSISTQPNSCSFCSPPNVSVLTCWKVLAVLVLFPQTRIGSLSKYSKQSRLPGYRARPSIACAPKASWYRHRHHHSPTNASFDSPDQIRKLRTVLLKANSK